MTFDERTYGSKTSPTEPYRDVKDIARDVRADIKAAIKDGRLVLPEGASVGVRISRFSGGTSINVEVRGLKSSQVFLGRDDWDRSRIVEPVADRANAVLTALLGAYNYDGSDTMTDHFDVRFYGSVTWCGGASFRSRTSA